MKTILGIQIPENLADLDNDALKALATSLRQAALAAVNEGVDPAGLAEVKEARTLADQATTTLAERQAADEAHAAEVQAEAEALAAELADDTDEDAADESDEDDAADDSDDEGDGEDASDEAADKTPVTAAYKPKAAAVQAQAPESPAPVQAETFGTYEDAGFESTSASNGVDAGEKFESMAQLGQSLMDRWDTIKGARDGKVAVGRLAGRFTDAQKLTEDPAANLAILGGPDPLSKKAQKAVTAAMCAPAEPTYALATMSSTARPVKASLATYQPARGRVSVYPTPKLGDIADDTGRGIWTRADDADSEAVKNACATIPCANSVTYDIYGIYRCLTVTNMLSMTFPELVEAYLNRLGALTARLGDSTLLDAMIGSTNTKALTRSGNTFGASINLFNTIIDSVALYREEERYGDQQFDAWIPRWVVPALQHDVMNMRRTSGSVRERLVSQAEIEAMLRDVGVDVTWTLDFASTWETPAPLVDGDAIPELPTTIDFIVAPKGNFRALDRGDLTVGVANGNIYRDNASNTVNQFTIFQESFEGLMDLGATNLAVTISDVCLRGTQTADVDALECAGS